jgi:hypothetical protein
MAAQLRPASRRTLVALGVVAIAALVFLAFLWNPLRSSTAAPGTLPAVPPPRGEPAMPSPEEGMPVPHLSGADAARIERGETLEFAMPGGGTITVGPPPKKKEGKE